MTGRRFRWMAVVWAVVALVAGACGDDDIATTEDTTVLVEGTELTIEVPVSTQSYVVTADVSGELDVAAVDPDDTTDVSNQRWDLVGPSAAVITVTVHDVRNTDYDGTDDEEPWPALYEFTGDELFPTDGFIGDTEEIEVAGGLAGFDLLLVGGTAGFPARMLVISLDGSHFVTIDTGFPADEAEGEAVEATYSTILDSVTVTTS